MDSPIASLRLLLGGVVEYKARSLLRVDWRCVLTCRFQSSVCSEVTIRCTRQSNYSDHEIRHEPCPLTPVRR